jgi:plastocyanin
VTAVIVVIASVAHNPLNVQPSYAAETSYELAQSTASNAVTIQGFQFRPDTITVKRGSIITFTNKDGTAHTVTPDRAGAFTGTGRLQQNDSKQVTFSQVGEQDYFCEIHPSMKGKVVVTN